MPKRNLSKLELKRLSFIRNLPYVELIEAHKVIEKGADAALLYFWFNLFKAYYHPLFKMPDVEKQVIYYCKRNPEFTDEIRKWFRDYRIKIESHEANSSVKGTIAQHS